MHDTNYLNIKMHERLRYIIWFTRAHTRTHRMRAHTHTHYIKYTQKTLRMG